MPTVTVYDALMYGSEKNEHKVKFIDKTSRFGSEVKPKSHSQLEHEKKLKERGGLEYLRYRLSEFTESNKRLISAIKLIIPTIIAIWLGYVTKWNVGVMAVTFAIVLLLTFLAGKFSLKVHIIAIVLAIGVGIVTENAIGIIVSMLVVYWFNRKED